MPSPADKFIEWFNSLPASHRIDIAAMCGICCIGYESIDTSSTDNHIPGQLLEIVEKSKGNPYREAATIIALRGFIQFFFITKRSERGYWEKAEKMLTGLAKEKESDTFEKLAREKRFEAEQWFVTCRKWTSLIDNHISDEQLNFFAP